MAQGSSYWKMIFTWSFDSGHAALAVEPPADRVRRGLGSLPKSPGGFPPPPQAGVSSTGEGGDCGVLRVGCPESSPEKQLGSSFLMAGVLRRWLSPLAAAQTPTIVACGGLD